MYCLIQIKYLESPHEDRHDLELLTPIGLPVVAANVQRPNSDILSLFPATLIPELTAMLNRDYQGWSLYSAKHIYNYDSYYVFAGAYLWLYKENEVKVEQAKVAAVNKGQPKQAKPKGWERAKFGETEVKLGKAKFGEPRGWELTPWKSNGRILNRGKSKEGNIEEMEIGDCEENSSNDSVLTPEEDEETVLAIR